MTCLVPAEAGLSILTLRFSLERILGGSLLIRLWGCQTLGWGVGGGGHWGKLRPFRLGLDLPRGSPSVLVPTALPLCPLPLLL